MKSVSQVSPFTPDSVMCSECEFNIFDFLPSEAHWLVLLKCFAEDNVEDLKIISKHVDWIKFVQSRDVHDVWLSCPPEFTRPATFMEPKHPFPTNPFFIAMFYNAKKCLLFMKESGVDFSKLTEHGLNAYHNLMSAIRFMTLSERKISSEPDYESLITLFHHKLFSRDQQTSMMESRSHRGMTPLSWGVYIGLAKQVEYILYYHSPNCTLIAESVGISEHITMDVSEYVGSNPEFFTSPICILLDLYGESTLPELKRVGIFRGGLIWKQWVDVLYERNKYNVLAFTVFSMALTFITTVFMGSSLTDYIRKRCDNQPYDFPSKTVGVLGMWVALSLLVCSLALLGAFRKEYYRHKVGYPRRPRQVYRDLLSWLAPHIIGLPISVFLLWLYVDTNRSCYIFGSQISTVCSIAIMILLLASVCLIVCYLRLVPFLRTMMSSFYNSLSAFTIFIVFFLILNGIFARMFQSNSLFSNTNNSTMNKPDTVSEFLIAFYMTFLVSLNVVDTNMFLPKEDRIDLNMTHIFFVLFVPILFINFVVGILSAVVTQVLDHEVENTYILKLQAADFSERTFFIMNNFWRKVLGSNTIKLSICQPLSKDSKLIAFFDDTLESLIQEKVLEQSI